MRNRENYNIWARAWRAKNPELVKKHNRNARQKAKDEAYEAYGGYVCVCCGETEPLFLSIDHVNNDGSYHRKQVMNQPKGGDICFWLRKHKYPAGFQILCHNCNHGRYLNSGICPHKEHNA